MCRSSPSPLDMLETTFRLLATGPHPLALDGPAVGLQAGRIGLWDLRAMVFHPAASASVQRAVLVELVGRARRHRGAWVVGLVGVLLPGLARPAGPTAGDAGSITDLDATVLAGLLEQLDTPAVPSEEVAEGLLWTVVRSPAEPVVPPAVGPIWLSSGLPCKKPVLTWRKWEVQVATKEKRARLLTPGELAEFLNVSPRTIETWRYQRKGPRAVRVGGVLRFRESDVEAWLEANADPAPQPR